MGLQRISIGLKEHEQERLRLLCKEADCTQNGLFVAMVSVCSIDEVKGILARFAKLKHIEQELRQAADANLMTYIRGRSLPELESMLEAVRKAQ